MLCFSSIYLQTFDERSRGGGAIVPANQGPKNVWGVKDYSLSGLFSTIIYWFNAAVLLFKIIDKVDMDGSSNHTVLRNNIGTG